MKNLYFILLSTVLFFTSQHEIFAQQGSIKICPGTPFWNANTSLVTNTNEMYNEYAKGPDGCWWLKSARHSSYKQGYYQFTSNKKYYYNKKIKGWENAQRTECLANPPFGN